MKKIITLGIMLLFLGMTISSTTGLNLEKQSTIATLDGNTLYVGGNGTGNYTTIQAAIDDASNGDTVYVYDDSSPYYEKVMVNVSINLIGEGRNTTEIHYWDEYTVNISANMINISGFKLGNPDASLIVNSPYNNISNNFFSGFESEGYVGIVLSNNNKDNIISDNIFYRYCLYNIYISDFCTNTAIIDNTLLNNWHDIVIRNSCHNTTIIGNKIIGTGCCAVIDISSSNNNIIKDNYLAPDWINGIELHSSHNNTIYNNTIIGNMKCLGIELYNSRYNNIFDNSLVRSGLTVRNTSQNNVTNNTVNNKPLVYLENTSDSIIPDNTGQVILIHCDNITVQNQNLSNTSEGVSLWETTNCFISNCFFSNNRNGIRAYNSQYNIITGNNITNKNVNSIEFYQSQNNTIIGNNITNNHGEIRFWSSQYNTIMDNFISNNSWGVTFTDSQYNTIIGNIITDGYRGIEFQDFQDSSNYNKITNNIISNQDGYGIYIWSNCYNNIIYHNNFFNNEHNAKDKGSNTWDDGYPSGGNYWDDYNGTDADGDGIGDTPYPIPGDDNEDRYPLMEPIGNDSIPPVTTISFNPPYPDGDNGWYVSNVTVALKATDDIGVKAIYYRVAGGEWINQTGDVLTFILDYDCLEDGLIEFYSVDYFGNQEETKSVSIYMDQLPPEVELEVETYKEGGKWYVTFIVNATDACSGMGGIEFFINDGFHEEVIGSGPTYEFAIEWSKAFKTVTFWFYCYDNAGNIASVSVNGSDIKSYSHSQSSSTQQSQNVWFLWLLERFPLLKWLLDIIGW